MKTKSKPIRIVRFHFFVTLILDATVNVASNTADVPGKNIGRSLPRNRSRSCLPSWISIAPPAPKTATSVSPCANYYAEQNIHESRRSRHVRTHHLPNSNLFTLLSPLSQEPLAIELRPKNKPW
jgi:hypothetical protein